MTHSSLVLLLAAVGCTLGGQAAAQSTVDTSQWACERCPYPKGAASQIQAAIEAGGVLVKDRTHVFGDYSGLDRAKGYVLLGGEVSLRQAGGYFADASAADLGTGTRSLSAQSGREGLYTLSLGYSEIPRRYAEGASTPFSGVGSSTLTLPAGFARPTTATMPLAANLQPAELGLTYSSLDLGGSAIGPAGFSFRAHVRHDVRDGTRPGSGSFFSSATQLPLAVNETTDQLELGVSYTSSSWQLSLSYLLSQFRNGNTAQVWDNPFSPVVTGATRGSLALAPDNRFQQLTASVGYQITPIIRASADVSAGKGTQDASFLPVTANASLISAALPAASLGGEVNTYNANIKVTATPSKALRITGSYARDVRENDSPILVMPQVATDMFVSLLTRSNTPFNLTQDRIKLAADYRGPANWRVAGGVDWDQRERSYTEVQRTQETTVWARGEARPLKELALSLKLSHAQREGSTYGIAYWFPAQNPGLRQPQLADRRRSMASATAEWTVSETMSVSVGADYNNDDYTASPIGLNQSRGGGINASFSVSPSEQLQISLFAQAERQRWRLNGSEALGATDWTASAKDRFDVVGLTAKFAAIPDKLDLGAEVSAARARRDTGVQTAALEPGFPLARNNSDIVKLFASYKLNDRITLNASLAYEALSVQDWALDGVAPNSVFNLLSFGSTAPNYKVTVGRASLRYRF